MESRWRWLIRLLTRRLWFKAGLYGIAAVATALTGAMVSPLVPDTLSELVGAEAVKGILQILASSMLAVATFSLGTMVSAFAVAAGSATPRASKLLVEDPISQNVLSTFIGTFIFSLVGLIALSTGIYGPGGRLVLFVVTTIVIVAVLTTFFRWIDYLSNLGRLSETLAKVEFAAAEAMRTRREDPYLSCSPLRSTSQEAFAHGGERIGYVQHIDVGVLQKAAENADGQVWVGCLPGSFVDPTRTLFRTSWQIEDDEERQRLQAAFLVEDTRTFDQDPRFGLIVMSEIASRALSPGINDPGTAIDVIGRGVRVLSIWSADAPDTEPKYPRVFVPSIVIADIFEDFFGPIARDGAGTFEVGIRLQKALAALARNNPTRFAAPAEFHACSALQLSDRALVLDSQKTALRELYATGFGVTEVPASS